MVQALCRRRFNYTQSKTVKWRELSRIKQITLRGVNAAVDATKLPSRPPHLAEL
jgi:hypothetical protein